MIEPFETIHLFEGGYCQIIGADYGASAYQSELTTFSALLSNIESLAPQGVTVVPFSQVNIFRDARSFYITTDVSSDYHFHVEDMDETILNNFITELKSFS
jgi:hypothetical protein